MAQNVIKNLTELGIDVKATVQMLNKALADEYLAAQQYLAPIGLAVGKLRPEVEAEFKKHYDEELGHAQMLKDRIIQLGGIPLQSPEEWYAHTNCGYTKPTDYNTKVLVAQNLDAERKAEDVYLAIMKACKEAGDMVTYKIARNILIDEEEHEQDLEDFLNDMEII